MPATAHDAYFCRGIMESLQVIYESRKRTRARERQREAEQMLRDGRTDDEEEMSTSEDDGRSCRDQSCMMRRSLWESLQGLPTGWRWQRRVLLTLVISMSYFGLVASAYYTIVHDHARWRSLRLEPGATAYVEFKEPHKCLEVQIWDSRPLGTSSTYLRKFTKVLSEVLLDIRIVEKNVAGDGLSHDLTTQIHLVSHPPGPPECEAADVTFKEVFALSKKSDFVAREFYLAAGSTWKYRLKAHVNAPVSVLHLSWEEFQMWKITPKLINCAAASSRGKTNMMQDHPDSGRPGWGPSFRAGVKEVEWQVAEEGRYVLVFTSAAKDARNRTNVNGALGAVAHHIRRKAHCKHEKGTDDEIDQCMRTSEQDGLECRQPVGVIVRVPHAPARRQHTSFSPAVATEAEVVQTSTEAWRCRTDSRLQEALVSLVGVPEVLHGLFIFTAAIILSILLPPLTAAVGLPEEGLQHDERYDQDGGRNDRNQDRENGIGGKAQEPGGIFRDMKIHEMREILRRRGVSEHALNACVERDDLAKLFESSPRVSGVKVEGQSRMDGIKDCERGTWKHGGEAWRREGNPTGGSESRSRLGGTGGWGSGDGILQVMLRTHERQYAEFEKRAKAKELVEPNEIPWPSLAIFKEQLRQFSCSSAQVQRSKVAKEWSRRWHPDKWCQYNLGSDREATLSRVTEVSKEINSVPICISSNDSQVLRYQTHCPACNAIMLFEIGREHEGKRARFTCPRCSKTLEASTGLD